MLRRALWSVLLMISAVPGGANGMFLDLASFEPALMMANNRLQSPWTYDAAAHRFTSTVPYGSPEVPVRIGTLSGPSMTADDIVGLLTVTATVPSTGEGGKGSYSLAAESPELGVVNRTEVLAGTITDSGFGMNGDQFQVSGPVTSVSPEIQKLVSHPLSFAMIRYLMIEPQQFLTNHSDVSGESPDIFLFSSIPEPSTVGLLGLCMAGLVVTTLRSRSFRQTGCQGEVERHGVTGIA